MNKKIHDGIAGAMHGFGFKELQTAIQINSQIERYGYTWKDFVEWRAQVTKDSDFSPEVPPMPERVRQLLAKYGLNWADFEVWVSFISKQPKVCILERKCPECGAQCFISNVSESPETAVDEKFKYQWSCQCGWYELIEELKDENVAPYLKEV